MDFSSFSLLLQDLLAKNKSVIIPGFGCFVMEETNSEIQFSGKIISPPQVNLLFCTSEISDDGVLLDAFLERKSINRLKGEVLFNEFVDSIKKELDNTGEVLFDNIGRVNKDSNGNLYFTPVHSDELFYACLPLEPVSVKPLEKMEVREDVAIAADPFVLSIDEDEPVILVEMESVENVHSDGEGEDELVLSIINSTLEEDSGLDKSFEIEQEKAEQLQDEVLAAGVDNKLKKGLSKMQIALIVIGIALLCIILIMILFNEQVYKLLESLLYSKEELDILRNAGDL